MKGKDIGLEKPGKPVSGKAGNPISEGNTDEHEPINNAGRLKKKDSISNVKTAETAEAGSIAASSAEPPVAAASTFIKKPKKSVADKSEPMTTVPRGTAVGKAKKRPVVSGETLAAESESSQAKASPAARTKMPRTFVFGGWRYSVKRIILSALAIILAVGIGIGANFGYTVFANQRMAFDPPPEPIVTPAPTPVLPDAPTPTPDPYEDVNRLADTSYMNDIVNILLIGVDHAEERDNWHKYFYSDVMMVMAVNFKQNKVDLISCPRDTYAEIYNVDGKYKLNSSMYWGGGIDKEGPLYVMRSVETLLGGIKINNYAAVDISGLKKVVDAIGGVDFDVDITVKLQGRVLNPGFQHLNGQQAVDYMRARKGIDNDIGRGMRQKRMLVEIFKQLKGSKELANLPNIIAALQSTVRTDLTFGELCALAAFGSKLDDKNIAIATLKGKLVMIYNWIYYIVDQDAKVKLVKDVYGVQIKRDLTRGWHYVQLDWAMMQAANYIEIVNGVVGQDNAKPPEQQLLTPDQKAQLTAAIEVVQSALTEAVPVLDEAASKQSKDSTMADKVNAAKNALKLLTTTFCDPVGIGIKWFVDENPGLERLTG
jgi:LCP family protein required for cell wall assembly